MGSCHGYHCGFSDTQTPQIIEWRMTWLYKSYAHSLGTISSRINHLFTRILSPCDTKKKHKMLSCLSSQSPSVTLTGSIRNYLPSSFLILSLLWWCWVHKSWITIVPTCSNQEKGICLSIYPFSQMNIVLVLPLHSCAKWWWSRWLKCFVGSGRTTRKEGVKYV